MTDYILNKAGPNVVGSTGESETEGGRLIWRATDQKRTLSALVNGAVDDIGHAAELDGPGVDLMNLIVNVILHRAEHPDATLKDVVASCYDEDLDTVLGWWLNG